MLSARSEFFSGVNDVLPILLGVIAFGLIYGVLAIDAGLSAGQTQAMSFIVFAGSSQFVMAQLFGFGTPALVIVSTALMLNLRHVLYSASVAPYLKALRPRWRWVLAYLLTDEAYAVTITHYHQDSHRKYKHWFFLGSGLTLWSTWQISTAAGIWLGAEIPANWSLDFTVALTFIALVVPALEDWAGIAAALTAGVAAILLFQLPLNLGLIVASIIGILTGILVENRRKPTMKETGA
jgi:4-azaleucine resistance transporter AzlC